MSRANTREPGTREMWIEKARLELAAHSTVAPASWEIYGISIDGVGKSRGKIDVCQLSMYFPRISHQCSLQPSQCF